MQSFSDFVRDHLDRTPSPSQSLPVFASTAARGALFCGLAVTHDDAAALGLLSGLSCERVSRAVLAGDPRQFFVLRG